MDKRIISFLEKNKVLSYCSHANDELHCASCYYAYLIDDDNHYLIFKSDVETKHIQYALKNKGVAGTILPESSKVASIQGIQFSGDFVNVEAMSLESVKKAYYKKFPFALSMPGTVWAIELNQLKFTDNTLGFGKKLIWSKADNE